MRKIATTLVIVSVLTAACGTSNQTADSPTAINTSDSTAEQEPTAIRTIHPRPKDDAWSAYEAFGSTDRAAMSATWQAVFAICDLRQEVNSGGFDSYLRYWGGDTAPIALAALPDVLGDEWARLLGDAVSAFGATYPADADARAEILDEGHLNQVLADLDSRFFDLEGSANADALVNAYLVAAS